MEVFDVWKIAKLELHSFIHMTSCGLAAKG